MPPFWPHPKMHFADLTLCRYHSGPFDADSWVAPLLAVGWLEEPHSFTTGEVPAALVSRLRTLLTQTKGLYLQFGFRGVHVCSLCASKSQASPSEPGWSQENLFVPGTEEVYVTPGGVLHYIENHSYLPPSSFLAAVSRCPDVDSLGYRQALRQANADVQPPLEETWAECLAKSKAFAEAVVANRRLPRGGN